MEEFEDGGVWPRMGEFMVGCFVSFLSETGIDIVKNMTGSSLSNDIILGKDCCLCSKRSCKVS